MAVSYLSAYTAFLVIQWAAVRHWFGPASQTAYLTARTGDPLYRINITKPAQLGRVDRTKLAARTAAARRSLDAEGVLPVHPLLNPVLGLIVSQKYGLLFVLAAPAWFVLRRLKPYIARVSGYKLLRS